MNRYLSIAACTLSVLALPAHAAMLLGNAKVGEQLVKQRCAACHASMVGGDGSKIFTRKDHKVKSPEGLLAQVERCNENLNTRLTQDQINDFVKYLSDTYYKFKD